MERDEVFTKYRPLAFKLAGRYARLYRIPQYEAIDEALSILGMTAARWADGTPEAYDPARSCATSWVYRSLSWGLSSWCVKTKVQNAREKQSLSNSKGGMTTEMHRNRLKLRDRGDEVRIKGEYTDRTEGKAKDGRSFYGRLESVFRELGTDARIVVETILNAPAEIAEELTPRTRGRGREAVRNYLRRKGWTAARLETAWAEAEAAI